jgi:UDP-N-acetylglucosamine 2-epimerase (non-hydrolysing)
LKGVVLKILTLFGTRPEIIRLSRVIVQLDRFCEQTIVHTGQNYDSQLSDVFFKELGLREPDRQLAVRGTTFAEQAAQIIQRTDEILAELQPDRLLILGDTNSGLAAIAAARRGVPVYHLEAGNRAFDDRIPEEINRRIIDHCSAVLMPYTHRSKENLLREGIERQRIFVVGNPIYEVLRSHEQHIEGSGVLSQLGIGAGEYFAATLHRAENVDDPQRLRDLFAGLQLVAERHKSPVVVSVHPRTRDSMKRSGLTVDGRSVQVHEPLGFFDFVALEKSAKCVLSDSGTVQEECCIFGIPNVTIRDVTERPETLECGSSILSGSDPEWMAHAVEMALGSSCDWVPPSEYLSDSVSRTVTKIVLGFQHRTR